MTDAVLDASALLALLKDEPGADKVAAVIGTAAISAVNVQEVAKEMLREGATFEAARGVLDELNLDVRSHDSEAAYASAALHEHTREFGRGLGDRTCMALGMQLGVPVLTADREWKRVEVEGLTLEHIR